MQRQTDSGVANHKIIDMMNKIFVLALSLVLALPFVMVADDHEEGFELTVVGSAFEWDGII